MVGQVLSRQPNSVSVTDPCHVNVPQKEYRNKTITRIFGGNARLGCYFFAGCIFFAGRLRDYLYVANFFLYLSFFSFYYLSSTLPSLSSYQSIYPFLLQATYQHAHINSYLSAILEQPRARILPTPFETLVPAALFVIGQIFVVTSTRSLGITGRFLGDYFGIIMDARVETFPYNVFHNPIYVGSTMCFAATALWCVPCSR